MENELLLNLKLKIGDDIKELYIVEGKCPNCRAWGARETPPMTAEKIINEQYNYEVLFGCPKCGIPFKKSISNGLTITLYEVTKIGVTNKLNHKLYLKSLQEKKLLENKEREKAISMGFEKYLAETFSTYSIFISKLDVPGGSYTYQLGLKKEEELTPILVCISKEELEQTPDLWKKDFKKKIKKKDEDLKILKKLSKKYPEETKKLIKEN